MLLKPALSSIAVVALASQAAASNHFNTEHRHEMRAEESAAMYHYKRGLLDGLSGVLGQLTGGLTSGLGLGNLPVLNGNTGVSNQNNIMSGLLGAVGLTLNQVLGIVSDLPRVVLPFPTGNTTGYIQITSDTGVNGFLGAPISSSNPTGIPLTYGVVQNQKDAVIATLPSISCLTLQTVFPIYAPFTGQPGATPFLGVTASKLITTFEPTAGAGGFGILTGTNLTAAGTYATGLSPYPTFGGEATIWSIECSSRKLTANWVAAGGVRVPLHFMLYDVATGFMEATGNIAAYNALTQNSKTNPSGKEFTFTFVPQNEKDLVTWGIL